MKKTSFNPRHLSRIVFFSAVVVSLWTIYVRWEIFGILFRLKFGDSRARTSVLRAEMKPRFEKWQTIPAEDVWRIGPYLDCISDPDPGVRENAVHFMRFCSEPWYYLRLACCDTHPSVRKQVAIAIAFSDLGEHIEGLRALERLLSDDDDVVRFYALASLAFHREAYALGVSRGLLDGDLSAGFVRCPKSQDLRTSGRRSGSGLPHREALDPTTQQIASIPGDIMVEGSDFLCYHRADGQYIRTEGQDYASSFTLRSNLIVYIIALLLGEVTNDYLPYPGNGYEYVTQCE